MNKAVEEIRLMVDPSVPQEMILFPDKETKKWFENKLKENDDLDEACHQKTLEIIKLKKQTPTLEAIIAKIEAEKLDEKDLHINYQIEPFNYALDKAISIIREEWGI